MGGNRLVWIDLEMTGLDIVNDQIIEIATLVTDGELNLIAEGPTSPFTSAMKPSPAWTNGTPSTTTEAALLTASGPKASP